MHHFYEAMEGAVRTFSPTLQIQIKSKISALVSEFELKNLEEENNLPTRLISRPMIPDSERTKYVPVHPLAVILILHQADHCRLLIKHIKA